MLIGVRAGLLRCWRGQRPRLGAEACGLVGKSGLPDKACGLRRIVDGGPHRCWPTYCLRREKQGQHAEDATCRMNTGLSAASREPNPSDRCWITADLAALGPAAMSLFTAPVKWNCPRPFIPRLLGLVGATQGWRSHLVRRTRCCALLLHATPMRRASPATGGNVSAPGGARRLLRPPTARWRLLPSRVLQRQDPRSRPPGSARANSRTSDLRLAGAARQSSVSSFTRARRWGAASCHRRRPSAFRSTAACCRSCAPTAKPAQHPPCAGSPVLTLLAPASRFSQRRLLFDWRQLEIPNVVACAVLLPGRGFSMHVDTRS